MNSDVASRNGILPSLSAATAAALPLGSPACETRQNPTSRRSLEKGVRLFRTEVCDYWKKSGRHHLAWRKTKDPYKILVSEVMLQQTQVSRVEGKYREFLKMFPNMGALAKAPLADVLRIWSGLGYNRRAKFLHNTAKELAKRKMPRDLDSLRALPGVGDYTAKAVRVFAFNEPETLIETNVRTAILHHFFPRRKKVSDVEILRLAHEAAQDQDPRLWHFALMDYGAYLKASGVRLNARSAHYAKQSKFEGSLRQVRGEILKAIAKEAPLTEVKMKYSNRFEPAFTSLLREGLVEKR